MSISALAFAALGLTASAEQECDLSDGLALQPAAFQMEAAACFRGVEGARSDISMESEILRLAAEARSDTGRAALDNLSTLNDAARIHAFDMAVRGYIAHEDPEGRGHLDRVALLDRSHLMGAFGANIAVIDDSATPEQAFGALMSDPVNADNLVRSAFDHWGIAAVRANGRIYLVQLFSSVEGRLDDPLTAQVIGRADEGRRIRG